MLTGTHPLKHRVFYLEKKCSIPKSIKTLAEILKSFGYMTFGLANSNRYGGGNWKYGFYRGMYHYTTLFPYNNMMEFVPEHFSWLLDMVKSNPFFMYIHTNDTHEPFSASKPFGSKWGDGYINKYEGEVSYVDHYFGTLLKEIKKRGLEENTLIVVTSDHGTEFAEHGFYEKKLNLYEEISRVPLMFSLPSRLPENKKINGLCETIDIAPTILDICNLPVPELMDGKSLLPGISKKGKPSEYVIAHTLHETSYNYEHFSIRDTQYKFIRTTPISKYPMKLPGERGKRFERLHSVANFKKGIWRELYDVKKDPYEKKNVVCELPAIAKRFEKKLDKYISSFSYITKKSKLSI